MKLCAAGSVPMLCSPNRAAAPASRETRNQARARSSRSLALALALTIEFLLGPPGALNAQPSPLRIVTPDGPHEVAAATIGSDAFFPVAVLDRFGASIQADGRGARAVLFNDTIVFTALSSFFRAGGDLVHLAYPVGTVGGVLQLPEQFFVEWLPARYPGRIAFSDGTLRFTPPAAVASAGGVARAEPDRGELRPEAVAPAGSPVVVIDPGHGGRDPGKIGPTGLKEKDFTLALGVRLARILRDRGYEIHLTRAHDTLVALDDRPRIANRLKADRPALFMSIHANSHASARVRGFETFFLSEARTEDERRVAEMENAAAEYDGAPAANGGVVDQILSDMRNDFYVRASNDLAGIVQSRLAGFHAGPNRGVKRAGFRVLVGALMPAVLVEVAFISNPSEARLLGTSAFQQRIAWELADAVDDFFARSGHLWAGSR